jgi:hypothetical protein
VAADERIRIEIGFEGGQTIGALVTPAAVDELTRALERSPEGAVALETEDATYVVPVRAVVYLKRSARETQIGFGRTA